MLFKISTEFSQQEAQAVLDAIHIIFDGPGANVDSFLSGLPGSVFYITKDAGAANAAYRGRRDLSSFSFYDVNPTTGAFTIPQNAVGPTNGERLSIGEVYVQNAVNGVAIGTKASPTGLLQTSLSRTIFHELAHAVTIPDNRNAANFGLDKTPYAGVEALAIAAEDLIYAKDRHLPSRIGHNPNLLDQSFDPALPFRNVTNVYYQTVNQPKSGISGVFFGLDVDGGTIQKAYGHTGPVLNNVTITGTKSQIVSDVGGLSQTFKDSLSGILSDARSVRQNLATTATEIKLLSASEALLGNNQAILAAVPSITNWGDFNLSSLSSVTGFSNERFTDGNYAAGGKTVNYVGPINASDGQSNLNIEAAVPQIVIGASGFYDGSKSIDLRSASETLTGADGGTNILMAGSGQGTGVLHTLLGGTGDDILIGAAGDDIIQADAGTDLVVQSSGLDRVVGNGQTIFAVSDVDSSPIVDTRGQTTVSGSDPKSGVTTLIGVHIFVGGSQLTTFIGNDLTSDIFIAGAGGGDFTLQSGDVAIGNPDAKKGNIYRVTTQDIQDGHVAIVGFGKNDKLYVDGKLFNGSTISAKITGQSWDSNNDFAEAGGVLLTGSSSWGFKSPPPTLETGTRDDGFKYHYWNYGSGDLQTVQYVKSSDSTTANGSGDIKFYTGTQSGIGSSNEFDISITGWSQGYGGISFTENNLARDLLGGFTLPAGVFSSGVLSKGSSSYYSTWANGGNSSGSFVSVGSAFGVNSTDWQTSAISGYTTGQSIADLITAALSSTGNSGGAGGGTPTPPSFPGLPGGGIGGISDNSGDDDDGPIILEGDSDSNNLDPGGTYSTVIGHGGGDVITFGVGYGILTLDEEDSGPLPSNELSFKTGILPGQVDVFGTSEGDIVLSVSDADQVVLVGALRSTADLAKGVQTVSFVDGTTWTYADLLASVETATVYGGTVYGDANANTLDTASVAGSVVGGGGGDVLVYNAGYGAVTFDEQDTTVTPVTPANTLVFGEGLDGSLATVYGRANGSLIIDFGGGDIVTLTKALLSTQNVAYGVQQVQFADGTSWSYADLLNRADTASSSNLTLYGDATANLLDGLGIATALIGGGGGDTFVFWNGNQPITIDEQDGASAPTNELELHGFDSVDVSVRGDADGNLILSAGGQDQVILKNALLNAGGTTFGIQQVLFDSGDAWTYSDLLARADTATTENTTLYGDGAANTINPMGVATSVVGRGGGDTFVYDRGYGQLSILETDTNPAAMNVLALGAGISTDDVSVSANATGDLLLDFGGGNIVTLVGALISTADNLNGVEAVSFADGTVWTYSDLLNRVLTPSSVGGTLYGDSKSNVLDGAGISTTLVGNGGNDTFVYNFGYGDLVIEEHDVASANNSLSFGTDIDPANVNLTATKDGSILLSLSDGSVVTLAGALNTDKNVSTGVQSISYTDGTIWTYQDLLTRLQNPITGSSTIYGDATANMLDSAGLASAVVGGGGGDTIYFERGYGVVTVDERDSSSQPSNTLVFGDGIDPQAVLVSANAAGDILIDVGSGDIVSIRNALNNTGEISFGIQEIDFSDGTSWSYDDLLAKAETPSTVNTTLYGDASANVLDGQGLAHALVGGGGGDTFIFGLGYGALTIDEQDQGGEPNILNLGADILPDAITVSANAAGDLLLDMGGGDLVTIRNALNGDGNTMFGVQQVVFADGTAWSYNDLLSKADVGSAGQPVLFGDDSANTFDSRGLSHAVVGRGGGDIIKYEAGYGALSIDESDGGADPFNTLALGADINPDDVSVSTATDGGILLSLGGADVITLVGAALSDPNAAHGVQRITFANGQVWDSAQLRAFASGSWQIGAGGQQTIIDEATNSAATTPSINIAFASTDVALVMGGDRTSLSITANDGTSLTISDILRHGSGGAQLIHFSDGVTWTLAQAIGNAAFASDLSNYVTGTEAAEDFHFGNGIQDVVGYGGGDVFWYNAGDGSVLIDEADPSATPNNTLRFGAGISLADLTITTDGSDLTLAFQNGDQITVSGALLSAPDNALGVQHVEFEDGTTLTYTQLLALADTGNENNIGILHGDANANVIDPAGYSHAVTGGGGSDTIVYNLGYGDVAILGYDQTAGANASIAFGAGITPNDIQIVPNISDPEYVSGEVDILVAGSTISIEQELSGTTPIISSLSFADGTVLSYADILAGLATPYAGKPAIAGDRGANTLDTQGLTHEVIGNGGGDTFVYNLGYGALDIEEYDHAQAPANRLLFGSGILPGDVAVSISYNGVATLRLSATDYVNFKTNLFDPSAGVQSIEFADGTIWNSSQLLDMSNQGSPGKTEILGHDFSETFDSRGYASYIAGRGGSDTYIFKPGYGALTINDLGYGADTDTLQLGAEINPADVIISKVGQDLVLSMGASDRVVVQYQFATSYPTYKPGIERVTFADGTIWSAGDIASRALAASTGSAAEVDTQSVVPGDVTLPVTTNSNLTATGTIGFTDVDAGDIHSANVVGVTYNDTLLSTLPSTYTMLSYLSASVNNEPDAGAAGAINWSFAAPSSAFNNLSPGESVDLVFTVQIKDQNNAVVTQNITVTVAAGLNGNTGTRFISGTSGDDILYVDRNEILNPGAGNDTIYTSGYGGTVTRFAKGDGQDHLINNSYYTARSDTLILTDTLADEVSVVRTGAATTLNIDATGDSFTADDQLFGNYTGIDRVQFMDGTSWSRSELFNRTAGTVTAIDSAGAILDGTSDTDTFTVGSGIGDAVINDFDTTGAHHDYLSFNRSQFSDWAHLLGATRQQGSDLVIDIDSTNSLTLAGVSLASFSQQNVKFSGMSA